MATIERTCRQLYGNTQTLVVDVPSGTDYKAGGLGCFGNMVGIAVVDAQGGGPVTFAGNGVWRCKYKTGERFSVGDEVFVDGDTWELIALPEDAGTYVCAGTAIAVDDTAETVDLVLNFVGITRTVTGS